MIGLLKWNFFCFPCRLVAIVNVDERIPTVSLGVPNTESGHCSKTMAIIDYLAAAGWMASTTTTGSRPDWYVIADDDTILG